jgi:hypothetical protein
MDDSGCSFMENEKYNFGFKVTEDEVDNFGCG